MQSDDRRGRVSRDLGGQTRGAASGGSGGETRDGGHQAGSRARWPFPEPAPAVHGGVDEGELRSQGIDPAAIVDFSSNQSPLGAAPSARAAAAGAVLDAYPDRNAEGLVAALAERHGVTAVQVVAGNGSTELIRLIAQIALLPDDVALSLAPSFGEYEVGTRLARARFEEVRLEPAHDASTSSGRRFVYDHQRFAAAVARLRPRLCWICSPNNPTGAVLPPDDLERSLRDFPDTLFVLDEAYCDLLSDAQWTPATLDLGNLLVLRSMTKLWGLAGLRLGYAIANVAVADALRRAKPPWNVNACAQAAGLAVLCEDDRHADAVDLLRRGRDELAAAIAALGFPVSGSAAGFFLIEVGDSAAARRVLLAHGCLIRDCTSFGLPHHVRVSPRHPEQNRRLIEGFAALAGSMRDGGTS
ncbi:MAG: histidinol-phosphate aminotransferase family protein [Actinobacteria bacterium]|nr:histidinol-phosphate aminotransferase family protein [Actinomycetota bacterium]